MLLVMWSGESEKSNQLLLFLLLSLVSLLIFTLTKKKKDEEKYFKYIASKCVSFLLILVQGNSMIGKLIN